jgi:hypothetical protein
MCGNNNVLAFDISQNKVDFFFDRHNLQVFTDEGCLSGKSVCMESRVISFTHITLLICEDLYAIHPHGFRVMIIRKKSNFFLR